MKYPKFEFVEMNGRERLSEGRSYGFGGAFCKRGGNTITGIMPLTACGDFYAEVIHSEITGANWSVYNFDYSKKDIYDAKNGVAYMVCGILTKNRSFEKYGKYDRDFVALEKNYQNLEKFINYFEEKFKLKKFTKIIKLAENRFLFILPLFWCGGTYKISLYKFLSRVGIFYEDGCPMEYLNNFNQSDEDRMMYNTIKDKVARMLNGDIPEQKWVNTIPARIILVSFRLNFRPLASYTRQIFQKWPRLTKRLS